MKLLLWIVLLNLGMIYVWYHCAIKPMLNDVNYVFNGLRGTCYAYFPFLLSSVTLLSFHMLPFSSFYSHFYHMLATITRGLSAHNNTEILVTNPREVHIDNVMSWLLTRKLKCDGTEKYLFHWWHQNVQMKLRVSYWYSSF